MTGAASTPEPLFVLCCGSARPAFFFWIGADRILSLWGGEVHMERSQCWSRAACQLHRIDRDSIEQRRRRVGACRMSRTDTRGRPEALIRCHEIARTGGSQLLPLHHVTAVFEIIISSAPPKPEADEGPTFLLLLPQDNKSIEIVVTDLQRTESSSPQAGPFVRAVGRVLLLLLLLLLEEGEAGKGQQQASQQQTLSRERPWRPRWRRSRTVRNCGRSC